MTSGSWTSFVATFRTQKNPIHALGNSHFVFTVIKLEHNVVFATFPAVTI
jgi:hypothetical protein